MGRRGARRTGHGTVAGPSGRWYWALQLNSLLIYLYCNFGVLYTPWHACAISFSLSCLSPLLERVCVLICRDVA